MFRLNGLLVSSDIVLSPYIYNIAPWSAKVKVLVVKEMSRDLVSGPESNLV